MSYKGQVPQSTGNRSKIDFCILLLCSETEKVDFLQNSSFKYQNINLRVYPYLFIPNATLKSLQKFDSYIRTFSDSVGNPNIFLIVYVF